jgi:hypothetical protein
VAELVDAAAAKKAVMHHALDKQENNDCRGSQQQKPSNLKPGMPWSLRGSSIRIR